MEIHVDVLNQLHFWNSECELGRTRNDFPFALALVLSLTSPEDMSKDGIQRDILDFVFGKLIEVYLYEKAKKNYFNYCSFQT